MALTSFQKRIALPAQAVEIREVRWQFYGEDEPGDDDAHEDDQEDVEDGEADRDGEGEYGGREDSDRQ